MFFVYNIYMQYAHMMKLVNIGDLKSLAVRLVGSSPTVGTNFISIWNSVYKIG